MLEEGEQVDLAEATQKKRGIHGVVDISKEVFHQMSKENIRYGVAYQGQLVNSDGSPSKGAPVRRWISNERPQYPGELFFVKRNTSRMRLDSAEKTAKASNISSSIQL